MWIINATSSPTKQTLQLTDNYNVQLVTTTVMCTIVNCFARTKQWMRHCLNTCTLLLPAQCNTMKMMRRTSRSFPHKGCHWMSLTTKSLTTNLTMRIFFHQILTLSLMTLKEAQTMVQT